ncbi:MAG TPA: hypothetical protein ENJ30_02665 [Desulfobulbaceae bacterium]|nr:hypothetical protein [Desulfobulbaceae bacterium]
MAAYAQGHPSGQPLFPHPAAAVIGKEAFPALEELVGDDLLVGRILFGSLAVDEMVRQRKHGFQGRAWKRLGGQRAGENRFKICSGYTENLFHHALASGKKLSITI